MLYSSLPLSVCTCLSVCVHVQVPLLSSPNCSIMKRSNSPDRDPQPGHSTQGGSDEKEDPQQEPRASVGPGGRPILAGAAQAFSSAAAGLPGNSFADLAALRSLIRHQVGQQSAPPGFPGFPRVGASGQPNHQELAHSLQRQQLSGQVVDNSSVVQRLLQNRGGALTLPQSGASSANAANSSAQPQLQQQRSAAELAMLANILAGRSATNPSGSGGVDQRYPSADLVYSSFLGGGQQQTAQLNRNDQQQQRQPESQLSSDAMAAFLRGGGGGAGQQNRSDSQMLPLVLSLQRQHQTQQLAHMQRQQQLQRQQLHEQQLLYLLNQQRNLQRQGQPQNLANDSNAVLSSLLSAETPEGAGSAAYVQNAMQNIMGLSGASTGTTRSPPPPTLGQGQLSGGGIGGQSQGPNSSGGGGGGATVSLPSSARASSPATSQKKQKTEMGSVASAAASSTCGAAGAASLSRASAAAARAPKASPKSKRSKATSNKKRKAPSSPSSSSSGDDDDSHQSGPVPQDCTAQKKKDAADPSSPSSAERGKYSVQIHTTPHHTDRECSPLGIEEDENWLSSFQCFGKLPTSG